VSDAWFAVCRPPRLNLIDMATRRFLFSDSDPDSDPDSVVSLIHNLVGYQLYFPFDGE
jgi:hypothetical protein